MAHTLTGNGSVVTITESHGNGVTEAWTVQKRTQRAITVARGCSARIYVVREFIPPATYRCTLMAEHFGGE